MSPSRGLPSPLLRLRFARWARLHRAYSSSAEAAGEESTPPKTAIQLLKNSPHRLHIYRSRSTNPFFNLSVEDYLLRHSPSESTILFTYINSPSIVIGRNQNPWSEINFPLLHSPDFSHVHFVRRRSGGGTVYHDHGNLCWSVIMPRKVFDRDVNALMVVRALKRLGISNAAVNERHDIVLKPTPGSSEKLDKKVSGSAYKITRDRAYHHATLLLDSDLGNIGQLLHSPLRDFMTSKGVDSVRSPVANIGVDSKELVREIELAFLQKNLEKPGEIVSIVNLEEKETIEKRDFIREGMEELQSTQWLYTQTPNFLLQIPAKTQLPELPGLPGLKPTIPEHGKCTILATNGKILNTTITSSPDPDFAFVQSQESHIRLLHKEFRGPVLDKTIKEINTLDEPTKSELSAWFNVAVGEWRGEQDFDYWVDKNGEKTLRAKAIERIRAKRIVGYGKRGTPRAKDGTMVDDVDVDDAVEESEQFVGEKMRKELGDILDSEGVVTILKNNGEFEIEGTATVVEKKDEEK